MTTPTSKSLASGLRGVEGDQKEDPVEGQDAWFNAAGMESQAVNEADHAWGERPPSPKHSPRDWVQTEWAVHAPKLRLPCGRPQIGPEQHAGQQSQEDGCGWMDGSRPSRGADEHQDSYQPDTEVDV